MSEQTAFTHYCYLYAIVLPGHVLPRQLSGLEGQPVMRIACDKVSAMVSRIGRASVQPLRIHLQAHNRVIRLLMDAGTVLPVTFGAIGMSVDDVQAVLASDSERLAAELARLAGKIEMGLRARLVVPDVYRHLLDCFPGLRSARDAAFRSEALTREDRIALGMRVERALDALREHYVAEVMPLLEPVCVEIRHKLPGAPDELMNFACLVSRSELRAFDTALDRAAQVIDDSLTFSLSGPWAPHHFCSIELGSTLNASAR